MNAADPYDLAGSTGLPPNHYRRDARRGEDVCPGSALRRRQVRKTAGPCTGAGGTEGRRALATTDGPIAAARRETRSIPIAMTNST